APCQFLGDGHGPVPTARATNPDREVALALGRIGRKQQGQQRLQPAEELAGDRTVQHVAPDVLILAGEGTQPLDPMRIGQEAAVRACSRTTRRTLACRQRVTPYRTTPPGGPSAGGCSGPWCRAPGPRRP